ncbi:MAG: thioredoxin [Clostridiales bacterium]|nr:thioredoxin [Clostridiales bacterium]
MSSGGRNSAVTVALIAGVCFLAAGVYGGEAMTVLRKAVYICLECIGIG